MKSLYLIFILFFLFITTGCQNIENKSRSITKKENEIIGKFMGQPESELKIVMGKPNEVKYDDKGSKFLIYKKKKYGITCEREFEIDQSKMVIGVSSRGCF